MLKRSLAFLLWAAFTLSQPAFAYNTVVSSPVSVGRQIITGTQTYVPDNGTVWIDVQCVGGGAGGGGAPLTGAAQASVGSGGGGGGYTRKRILTGFSGVTVTIGAGGTGVTGLAGNVGNSTTFGAILTAGGGTAGQPAGPAAATGANPGVGGSASGGDVNIPGGPGGAGAIFTTSLIANGAGGDSMLGFGGPQAITAAAGIIGNSSAAGFGGGGAGGAAGPSQGATAGGAGRIGVCIIDEYQ